MDIAGNLKVFGRCPGYLAPRYRPCFLGFPDHVVIIMEVCRGCWNFARVVGNMAGAPQSIQQLFIFCIICNIYWATKGSRTIIHSARFHSSSRPVSRFRLDQLLPLTFVRTGYRRGSRGGRHGTQCNSDRINSISDSTRRSAS
jgi:hypothetical protein